VAQPAQPTAEELAAASTLVAPIAQGPALPSKDIPTSPVAEAPVVATQPGAAQPGAVQPSAVKPGAAKKPVAVPRQAPTKKILPGDLICGECGEGNAPQRRFCSRCGSSLAAAVVAKEKWWRKLIPKRKQKSLAAGERTWKDASGNKKKSKMSFGRAAGKLRLVIGGLLLVAGMLYAAYSPFRDWVNTKYTTAKDKVMNVIRPQYTEVNAVPPALTNVDPALTQPDHDVGKLVDNFLNTTWIVPGAAVTATPKPAATITFGQPIDLERMIVYNGDGEQFQSFHRAKTLRLVFDNNKTDTIELKDVPEKQTVSVDHGSGISSVTIFVDDVYTAFQGNDLAVSEIEFFRKK
jgi:hypothetical protein